MRSLHVVVWLPFAAACTDGSLEPQPVAASRFAVIDQPLSALPAPAPSADDLFGSAVAFDEDQALVGIPGRDQSDDPADDSGSARLFRYTGQEGWEAADELVPVERVPLSNLGSSVALRGSNAAIGNAFASVLDDLEGAHAAAGLVYAFRSLPLAWQSQQLNDPELAADRWFGYALAALNDEIIVGAPSSGRPGSAYVYEWSTNGGWVLKQELIRPPSTAHVDDHFGWAIAADEGTLIVGAPGDLFETSGAAYVFERDEAGFWQTADTLRGAASPIVAGDGFGFSVAVRGRNALIGASGDFFSVAPVAYLFEQALGTWPETPTHEFRPGAASGLDDNFATKVGLGDNWIWIGAPEQMTGVVYPFELQDETWKPQSPLSTATRVGARFGAAIGARGRTALIGCPMDQDFRGNAFFAQQSNGSRCDGDFECTSGRCVEGICCDSQCNAHCYSCRAADKDSGPDGECGPISMFVQPPETDCPREDPASCGRTGMCDGSGECALHTAKTLCAEATCSGPAARRPDRYCDGFGECAPSGAVSCGRLVCSGGVCAPCTNDAACADGEFCGADGCEAKRGLMTACTDDRECESGSCPAGHCADGPECSEDATEVVSTDGTPVPCHPYLCVDAKCVTECTSSSDCQDAFACNARHECTPSSMSRGKTASSCGYSSTAESATSAWTVAACLMAIALGGRRPRRRSRRNAIAENGTHGFDKE